MLEYWLEPWLLREGRVFVDVGANVGTWTRRLAPHYAHVHAIEPNPEALPELREGLPDNATVHAVGAWQYDTQLTFTRFAASAHLSSYFKDQGINTGSKRGTIALPCRRIDSLNIPGPVDFLKCDTEGAEIECLRGAEELIFRDRPWLLVEVHSSRNFHALAALLAGWGYLFTVVRHPDYEPFSRLWYEHCWFSCQPSSPDAAAAKVGPYMPTHEALQQRLAALKAEREAGEKVLAAWRTQRAETRAMLLRISGAIQVLEEELSRTELPSMDDRR